MEKQALGSAFTKLWTASVLSNLADGILRIAVPLAAVRLTESPLLLGGLAFAMSLPWLVFALPIGAIADRVDRRKAMLAANAVRTVIVALVALLFVTGLANIWLLYLAAFVIGTAEVLYDTTAQSILPQVVGKAGLERANSRLYGAEIVANQFAGPPLGGLLVAIAVALGFGVSAGLWVFALLALIWMRGTYLPVRSDDDTPRTIRADIGEGLNFLWRNKVLRTLAIMTGLTNLAGAAGGAIIVLFAVGANSPMGLSEAQFGLLSIGTAIGAVLGSVVSTKFVKAVGRRNSLLFASATFIPFAFSPVLTANVWPIAAAMVLSGFGVMIWNVIAVSLRQALSPDAMLGRVNSCYRLLAWGSMPLGALIGGAIGESLGLRAVFVFATALAIVVVLIGTLVIRSSDLVLPENAPAETT
jgi:MFS family permease